MSSRDRAVRIPQPESSTAGGIHRVSAEIDDAPVYFESRDSELLPSPEAFGSALLIPALEAGRELRIESPVDPIWARNLAELTVIFSRWWGVPELLPQFVVAPADAGRNGHATGLCFTSGVDSFYSLLRGKDPVDALIFVQGYDMKLEDEWRMIHAERGMGAVAQATRTRLIVIRTNLREHPLMKFAHWDQAHGGALAAVGHLLTGALGRLIVASSYQRGLATPHGSHRRSDPLWSSSAIEVLHRGDERWRHDKLRAIGDERLVQQHLRVCWQNRARTGNCSRCEKCVRTMLTLAQCGKLADFEAFDREVPLVQRIDALEKVPGELARVFMHELGLGLDADVSRAIRDLLDRSIAKRRPWHRRRWKSLRARAGFR